MNWDDVSEKSRSVMRELGGFGPTVHPRDRVVKGVGYDPDDGTLSKAYYGSDDLREIAAACNEVADWLDKRASCA